MKNGVSLACSALLAALCTLIPIAAHSAVTLYGIIDTSLQYTTNNTGPNGTGSALSLTNGAMQGSRWGMTGNEDLGGGTSAVFALESGIFANNGTFDQQGQLFGRQAWVGLSDTDYGKLLVGRIYGIPFALLTDFDPLNNGNYLDSGYLARIIGVRFDNTMNYSIGRGPFSLTLQHGFGGQAGNMSAGSTNAIGLTYKQSDMEIGGVVHSSEDAAGHKLLILGGGGYYTVGQATLYLMYVNARRDAGFVQGSSTGTPLANTSLLSNANTIAGPNTQTARRVDSYVSVGARYWFSPALSVIGAYYLDNVRGVAGNASGKIRTYLLGVDYMFSKRTDVYALFNRNLLSGASVTDPNNPPLTFAGQSTRTTIGVGLRTRF